MSWETMSEDSWICPECGNEVRICFRMDDWNRREYIKTENGISSIEASPYLSPPTCKKCDIKMVLSKDNTINSFSK